MLNAIQSYDLKDLFRSLRTKDEQSHSLLDLIFTKVELLFFSISNFKDECDRNILTLYNPRGTIDLESHL